MNSNRMSGHTAQLLRRKNDADVQGHTISPGASGTRSEGGAEGQGGVVVGGCGLGE